METRTLPSLKIGHHGEPDLLLCHTEGPDLINLRPHYPSKPSYDHDDERQPDQDSNSKPDERGLNHYCTSALTSGVCAPLAACSLR